MPGDPSQDQDFLNAPSDQQHAYLMSADPDYAKAPPQEQQAYLHHVNSQNPLVTGKGMEHPTTPKPQMSYVDPLTGHNTGDYDPGAVRRAPNELTGDMETNDQVAADAGGTATIGSMAINPAATLRGVIGSGVGAYAGGKAGESIGGHWGKSAGDLGGQIGTIGGGLIGGGMGVAGKIPTGHVGLDTLKGLMSSGESAAPEAAMDEGVQVVPEPHRAFADENEGYMASVPREELPEMAQRGKLGAAKQRQQLGGRVLYAPNYIGKK